MDSRDHNDYSVVFDGQLISGIEPNEVKQRLGKLFKAEPSAIERLFGGKPVVLKKGVTQAQAEKMKQLVAQCGAVVTVHAPRQENPAVTTTATGEERRAQARCIIESFEGTLQPVKVPPLYKLGIAAVSFAMVLIPLVYISIIVAAGYMVAQHASENLWLMSTAQGGRSGLGGLIAYLAPIVIGAILIIFMLKPLLLLWQGHDENPLALSPERETDLFRFVHTICDKVNAARPCNIIVINEANAYAGFHQGIRGLLGNRLTLAIGLPLVAGMNTRQLAGILAHEFGHFAQGAGMRTTYIIRTINYWLHSSVYSRDKFDSQLDNWANNAPHLALMVVLHLARLFIWLTRKLLWLMMMAGNYLSSMMLRQMEFDADRYEAKMAGAQQFADTSRRLNLLSYAAHELDNDLYQMWSNNGFLLDNIPLAITDKANSYSIDQVTNINQLCDEHNTEVFDTHPADRERIANAQKEKSNGIFRIEAPASTLFAQYEKLCQQVTRHYYAYELRIKVKKENLISLDKFKNRVASTRRDDNAISYFFGNSYRGISPVAVPLNSGRAIRELADEWRKLCEQQQGLMPDSASVLEGYDRAVDGHYNATLAEVYLDAGFKIKHLEFGLESAEISHVLERIQEHKNSELLHYGQLLNLNTIIGSRLAVDAALLATPQLQSRLKNATKMADEFTHMQTLQNRLNTLVPELRDLVKNHAILDALLNAADSEEEFAQLAAAIQIFKEKCETSLNKIEEGVSGIAYPFEHSSGELNLYEYLFTSHYQDDELRTAYECGNSVSSGLLSLLYRVTGRLCMIAQTVEQACKLECTVSPQP